MLLAHAIYWTITHPVNKVWLGKEKLGAAGAAFFGIGKASSVGDWTTLRDRWEWSHVARATLMTFALVARVVAAVTPA